MSPTRIQTVIRRKFKKASEGKISPQVLRKWFAKEMRNQGVSGEHIDAFCGRLPKTIRAQHYTDFSSGRLKEVYEKADLKVLGITSLKTQKNDKASKSK